MKTLQQHDTKQVQQDGELLTAVQLANALGVSERTILSMRKRLHLPHYKFGRSIRYDRQAVLKVLGAETVP